MKKKFYLLMAITLIGITGITSVTVNAADLPPGETLPKDEYITEGKPIIIPDDEYDSTKIYIDEGERPDDYNPTYIYIDEDVQPDEYDPTKIILKKQYENNTNVNV